MATKTSSTDIQQQHREAVGRAYLQLAGAYAIINDYRQKAVHDDLVGDVLVGIGQLVTVASDTIEHSAHIAYPEKFVECGEHFILAAGLDKVLQTYCMEDDPLPIEVAQLADNILVRLLEMMGDLGLPHSPSAVDATEAVEA